jgi:branched-chain amino acid transport system ATP-binding protein
MLKLTDVSAYYGKVEALKNISLEVNAGEVVAMIGANGAGKTTTLRTISGLMKSTGRIEFAGARIDQSAPKDIVRRGISHVPEGGGVFPDMSVMENLELGACIRKDKQAIGDDMERIFTLFPRLRERVCQHAGTMSGGERQMLAVGRGLISKPKLLILDEPTLGLSPLMVQQLAEIISEINRSGQTILLVEQNARMALRLADRGYVLETGRICAEGTSAELSQNTHVKKAYLGK